ncbi:MAG: hypothetical protein HPY44_18690 [Armatimonadetes bacterium]|nr:hypothetical protein [Armatimonadota bacterium]
MRTLVCFCAALTVAVVVIPAQAQESMPYALLSRGTSLVPFRPVFEYLGATVDYVDGKATATRRGTIVELTVGSKIARIGGKPVRLSTAPRIVDYTLYVPLRFVSEALGAEVEYAGDGRSVHITAPGKPSWGLVVVKDKGAWRTYQGPWFDIDYPAGFSVSGDTFDLDPRGRLYSDAALFLSPGGAPVQFYVYSPQWSGKSEWAQPRADEKLGEVRTERRGSKTVTWTSVTGPGGYTRAWVETVDEMTNTNHVFGIKYRNQAAYSKYKAKYLEFKESLVQYAD